MEQKRIKVRLTKNSPYSDYGYYEKGDIGYIDGYVNDNAVIILENGKFAKADLRWIEVVNDEDKNVNTELAESEDERIRKGLIETCKQSLIVGGFHKDKVITWLEKQGEQKPEWSEEDKNRLEDLIDYLENERDNSEHEEDKAFFSENISWLKSLRPQKRWKPSEEQMKALDFAIDCTVYPEFQDKRMVLKELLEQLKEISYESKRSTREDLC